jgi:hypothetical protein
VRIVDVGLGDPGGADFNTLVLTGVDVVVPLEADLDGDPLHDDEVRLLSESGDFDVQLCANEPDVKHLADKNLYAYTFRDVPPGVYRVLVKVGEDWATVMGGLVVHRAGVRLDGKEVETEEPEALTEADVAETPPAEAAPPTLGMKLGEYMDVADNFFEED